MSTVIQYILYLAVLIALAIPLEAYIKKVMNGEKTFLSKILTPVSYTHLDVYKRQDIAFEFASWISPEFKLYIIKDYQRLKKDEANLLAIGWDAKRELSKINYRIHTDAVKEFLITPTLSPQETAYTYEMCIIDRY